MQQQLFHPWVDLRKASECVCALVFMFSAVSHLSDLLTDQRQEPDVEQQLPCRGRQLEVNHQHHSEQEEEGEVRHNIPVELDLRRVVQTGQSGPAAQRLQVLQAGIVTEESRVRGYVFMFNRCLTFVTPWENGNKPL